MINVREKRLLYMKQFSIAVCVVAFFAAFFIPNPRPALAATCAATVSGNWNTGANWSGCSGAGGVPGTGDNITINTGVTITMNTTSPILGTITINGTLNTSDGTSRALSGTTLTIGSTGTLTANISIITLSGTTGTPLTLSAGGTFNAGTSTITLTGNNAAGNTTISKDFSYYNLNLSNSSEVFVLEGATTVNAAGTLTITNGTLNTTASNYALSAGKINMATNNATCAFTANGSTITLTGTSGTLFTKQSAAVFTAGTSTVVLAGNGDATINSGVSPTFYNLTSSGTGTKTLGLALTITNILSITNGTFSTSTSNLALTTANLDLQSGGTLTLNASTLTLNGTDGDPVDSMAGTINVGTSTIAYTANNASGDSIISKDIPYYNLLINRSGEVFVLEGATTVDPVGILTISLGTLDTTASNYALTAGKISTANSASVTLNVNASLVTLTGTSGTLFSKGPNSVFNYSTSTFDFAGNGDITIASAALNFYNLRFTGSGTKTMAGTITVSNILTSTNGVLTTSASNFALTVANLDLQSGGTLMLNAATLTLTGTDGDPVDAISGTLNTGISTIIYSGNNASGTTIISKDISYYNLTTNNNSETYELEGDTTISPSGLLFVANGVLSTTTANYTLSAGKISVANIIGAVLTLNSSTVNLTATSGTLVTRSGANGLININTSTVVLAGNGDATLISATAPTFNNITVTGSGTKSLGMATSLSGTLTVTNGTFSTSGSNYALSAAKIDIEASGTFLANGSMITVNGASGSPLSNAGTFTAGTSTVVYSGNNGSGNTTIDSHTGYYNLTINNTSETFVLEGATTVDPAGTLTVTAGTLSTTESNYALSAGKINLSTVNSIFNANGSTISLTATSGNLFTKASTATFNAGTSVVDLVGNGDATINSGSPTFYTLKSSGTGTKTVSSTLTVGKDLIITNGTFAALTSIVYTAFGTINTLEVTNATIQAGGVSFGSNYQAFETFIMGAGSTVEYKSSSLQSIDETIDYVNLKISGTGPRNLNGIVSPTNVTGTLTIAGGSLDTVGSNRLLNVGSLVIESGTSLIANGSPITVTGNFTNRGTFTAGTSTVTFTGDGLSQISGATTFYNLAIINTLGKEVDFATGDSPRYTVTNEFTVTGHAGGLMKLRSDVSGTQWLFNPTGTASVSYADVKDGGCVAGSIVITPANSINSGNNGDCWSFGPSHYEIVDPGQAIAGTPFTVTVNVLRPDGTLDTSYQNDVTLVTTGGAMGAGLVTITDGTGTISLTDTVAETITLSLSDSQGTGLEMSSTQSVTVAPASTAVYLLNDPGNMYAKNRIGYTVTRKDQYGNVVTQGDKPVFLHSSSTSSTKAFYTSALGGSSVTSVTLQDGQSSVSFWYYDGEPGTYTITASDNMVSPDGTVGIDDAEDSLTVQPVAVQFVILPVSAATVDAPAVVTIQAQKSDTTVDTNYQEDVTVVVTGGATGAGLVNIVNGVGTISISDTTTETVTVSLLDSENTGLEATSAQEITFAGGVTAQVTLSHPKTVSAGNRVAYTVIRNDQYGNVTTTDSTTLYLYSTSTSSAKRFYDTATEGSAISFITIPDGQSSTDFWYYDESPGNYSITVSDNSSAPDGNVNINDGVDTLEVTPGPTDRFIINNPGEMTAETRLGFTVSRVDQFDNPVTFGDDTVYLYTTGDPTGAFYGESTGGSPITSTVITTGNSSTSVWYYTETPGEYIITASDNTTYPDGLDGLKDGTQTIVVNAAPIVASRFVISEVENSTVDTPVTVTVRAEDDRGNLDTTYEGSVTLRTTGAATGAGVVTIHSGLGTITISDAAAETITLSLMDSADTGFDVTSTRTVNFGAGLVSQFALNNPGDMAAGTRIGYTITRKDQYGNLVTTGATAVYLYSLPSAATNKFYDAESGGSVISYVTIPDGQSSAQFWYYDEAVGSVSITVSDNGTEPDGTAGIADISDLTDVAAGSVAKFVISNPGDMMVGTRTGYTVERQDQFSNPVVSGMTTVHLYTSSTGPQAKFYDSVSAGTVITSLVIDSGSTAQFWYYDETPGTWVITVSDGTPSPNGTTGVADDADSLEVSALPIVATRLILIPGDDVMVRHGIPVTIQAVDADGNIDTTWNGSVTLVTNGSATGGGVVTLSHGVGVATLVDLVAETISLSLLDTGSTGLNVSSVGQVRFTETPPVFTSGSWTEKTIPVKQVVMSGIAYPGAKVSIKAISDKETVLKETTVTSRDGSFKITFTGLTENAQAFALSVADKDGRSAQTKVFTLNLVNAQSVLALSSVLASPTVGFARPIVTKGDFLAVVGYAAPRSIVGVEIDDTIMASDVIASADGSYKYLFNTASLPYGSHTIRVNQTASGTVSEFSPQKIFFTTDLAVPKTDLNSDGKINISDWSIFLARWKSTDPSIRILDDLNNDAKVDVSDVSIFTRVLKQ